MTHPRCPGCDANQTTDLGRLPPWLGQFAGAPSARPLPAGHLWRCTRCDLRFQSPALSQSELSQLYEVSGARVWHASTAKDHWKTALDWIGRPCPDAVLDVGCGCGDFLELLPRETCKLGIEPSLAASNEASTRGIHIVAPSVEAATAPEEPLLAITAFDVLEHLVDPFAAVAMLSSWLAPGGQLILFTGIADFLPARLSGPSYWYCAIPEHVSYASFRWFEWTARRLGLHIDRAVRLPSAKGSKVAFLANGLRSGLYTLVRRARDRRVPEQLLGLIPGVRRATRWSGPPWWPEARDHLLISLRRPG